MRKKGLKVTEVIYLISLVSATLFCAAVGEAAILGRSNLGRPDCEIRNSRNFSSALSVARSMVLETPEAPSAIAAADPIPDAVTFQSPTFDFPMVMNQQVVKWLDYFQGTGRKHFIRWLTRFEKYAPMINKVLREYGLPEDLVYLAMIESGFQPVAKSHAKAVGMWQFMKGTGRLYGLKVNWWIDERRDPMKATLAAAQHLQDLYEQFNDWHLAAASYNAGSGKVTRAIRRKNSTDFWELAKTRYLHSETKNYVPKMLAAAIIAKNPDAYGFRGIQYQDPWAFELVEMDDFTDLRKVASLANISFDELKELNPELMRPFTPPNFESYPLRVPVGRASTVRALQEEDQLRGESHQAYLSHRVKSRETLSSIARRYGVPTLALLEINNLTRVKSLAVGTELRVPVGHFEKPKNRRAAYQRQVERDVSPVDVSGMMRYRVRRGDTLWSVARRFNVNMLDLKKWNRHVSGNKIYPGLVLHVKKSS